jgi:hypothetical protein
MVFICGFTAMDYMNVVAFYGTDCHSLLMRHYFISLRVPTVKEDKFDGIFLFFAEFAALLCINKL